MKIYLIFFVLVLVIVLFAFWFYRHQKMLSDRAHLMREAVRNGEFTFRLNRKGLFFGERAMQEALNDLGQDISGLVAKNEVESWQRLTRVLTHEIMNAMTPIKSISQSYLKNPKIKGTIYEEGIKAIHDTSVGLDSFIDSYRKLTDLQEPVPTDVSLNNLMDNVKTLYPDVVWHVSIPEDTILHVDENLLRQVLINLIKNAIEAGAKNIDIRWKDKLFVSNDGDPIPPDVRRDIFVPFFTTKETGNGIGLSLSRQILMKQDIDLTLRDTPISGYHTTFCIKKNGAM